MKSATLVMLLTASLSAETGSSRVLHVEDIVESVRKRYPSLLAALADVGRVIDERPGDVAAAIASLYPDLDRRSIEILMESESRAWKSRPYTAADMARD